MPDTSASGLMPDWLWQRARSTPARVALLYQGRAWSFRELDAWVDAAAAGLQEAGVRPGDVVALLGPNSPEYVVAVHALPRVGAVLQPINVRLTPSEVAWQLADSGARLLLYDERNAASAAAVAARPSGTGACPLLRLAASIRPPSLHEPRRYRLDAVHSLVYTSGTSGRPKAAMLTYGNHLWSATASAFNLGVMPDDRWLACLPLFHVGGLAILLRSVLYGTAVVLHSRFDPAAVNRSIDAERVTSVSVVANMLRRTLEERGERPYPSWLRCVLLGGGPAPQPLLEECARRGLPVVQTYGLTETASQVATLAPEDALTHLGSAGKPLFGSELRILDEDGLPSPPGKEGEVLVRGPTVTPGYLNRPEETARALRDGWLHTGDMGYLDDEGYLYILDRREDLIVSGGENVYPAEVEAVLLEYPGVSEAAVFGLPDERWGQSPAAAVVWAPAADQDASALVEYCRSRLAAYKLPRRVFSVDALPRTASGKLLRRELRQRFQGA